MAIAPPSDQASSQVRWLQVWGLASVQGAMSLTWIAYGIYLPKFIEQVFGYPTSQAQQLTALILVIESAIGVIVEPLFGGLSDRWQRWYSTRMPFIVAAAIASTALFIGLPCLVIFGGSSEITRVLLISIAILWAIVMATFRSPVMCLLGIFAGGNQITACRQCVNPSRWFCWFDQTLSDEIYCRAGRTRDFYDRLDCVTCQCGKLAKCDDLHSQKSQSRIRKKRTTTHSRMLEQLSNRLAGWSSDRFRHPLTDGVCVTTHDQS